jgi:hypothetical protein
MEEERERGRIINFFFRNGAGNYPKGRTVSNSHSVGQVL